MNNAFVVQPGTPVLLSSIPSSFEQQGQFSIGILGQFTSFVNGTTVVTIPGSGALISATNVTGPQSITVLGTVNALAYPGCSNIVVTTGAQVLTLYSAFCVTPGPAAITQISPNNGFTGTTIPIVITGTNTNWSQPTTVANFGPGIAQSGPLVVNSPTSVSANITIASNATPEGNTFTLTTAGETASGGPFTITAASPIIDIVSPSTGVQGTVVNPINITSSFTHFDTVNHPTTTTATVGGSDIVATVTVLSATSAQLSLNISPIAGLAVRSVRLTTPLGGGLSGNCHQAQFIYGDEERRRDQLHCAVFAGHGSPERQRRHYHR